GSREEARQAAETALALQPGLGEALLAMAEYHYYCLSDYSAAERYLERARPLLPNDTQIRVLMAKLVRQRGDWGQSESYFNEAKRLDPRNPQLSYVHGSSFRYQRRFDEARRELEQVLNIIPDDTMTFADKAGIAQAQGDLKQAAALLDPLPLSNTNVRDARCYQSLLERSPASIIPKLKEILSTNNSTDWGDRGEIQFWLGWLEEVMGDHAAAVENWRQARNELEFYLEEGPDHFLIAYLALLNAALGDKTAAFD